MHPREYKSDLLGGSCKHGDCSTAIGIAHQKHLGFLDDYTFPISGLLDLYEYGGEVSWPAWAIELQETQARK